MKIILSKEVTSVRYGVTFLQGVPYDAKYEKGFYFICCPETDHWVRLASTKIQEVYED
jgi:hypothetical protein